MSVSKLSLLAAAATLAISSLSAHADSLSLGSAGQSMFYFFDGGPQQAAGGNFSPSSAVIGGNPVNFSAVYCVDLNDNINDNSTYNNTVFTTSGVVNGSTVHNAADIAWLILNTKVTNSTQAAGLQAAIWETEYGNEFSLVSFGQTTIASDETADLNALNNATVSSSLVSELDWITPPTVTEGSGKNKQTVDQQGLVGLVNDPPPAVPEPATLSLFGTGILGLAGVVRRRLSA
jgi:PEP-CTERM motif/Thioester domain